MYSAGPEEEKILPRRVSFMAWYLDVRDGRESFLGVGVLRMEREEGGDAQRDSSRNGFRPDPEGDPGHDDDETRRDVRVEQVIAQASTERQDHFQASEIPCHTQ